MILILMGVAGSGKSTVAQALASLTGWQFAEGDAFHSEDNRAKMSAGIPLSDEDRVPWLERLYDLLVEWQKRGQCGILTCSALRQKYREILCGNIPREGCRFVMLEGSRELFEARLSQRRGHFMNPALLASQLATLELPEDAIRISVEQTPEEIAMEILERISIEPVVLEPIRSGA